MNGFSAFVLASLVDEFRAFSWSTCAGEGGEEGAAVPVMEAAKEAEVEIGEKGRTGEYSVVWIGEMREIAKMEDCAGEEESR